MLGLFALFGLGAAIKRPRIAKVGDSSQHCVFCHFYVSLIEDYLKDGHNVETITKKLEELCKHTSAFIQPVCVSLIDTAVPKIIELLEKEMEIHDICIYIKMCKD